ncbi:TIR domain-containing protein [Cryptosporangium sp. NPDC051539]|uniref:TIR domain-containing protein n=1 Tax=Cryptosporangium sp. NPDC051539 TaxID=3363962 RepID=UPI0037A472E7
MDTDGEAAPPPPRPDAADAAAPMSHLGRQFEWDVALSFSGAQQAYVQRVADTLQKAGVRYYYYPLERTPQWGQRLAEELRLIYGERARCVLIFLSAEYADGDWTRWEYRAALGRAVRERHEFLLVARFDDTRLPGLADDLATLDATVLSPQELAEAAITKIAALTAADASEPSPATPAPRTRNNSRLRWTIGAAAALVLAVALLVPLHTLLGTAEQPKPPAGGKFRVGYVDLYFDGFPDADAARLEHINDTLYRALGRLASDKPVETVRIPNTDGDTSPQRLSAVAESRHADIVFAGRYDPPPSTGLEAALYVSANQLDVEQSIAGYSELEGVGYDLLHNLTSEDDLERRVLALAEQYLDLFLAIGNYSAGDYEDAQRWLDTSARSASPGSKNPPEKFYDLMNGNLAGKQRDWTAAEKWYRSALRDDPSYARAQLGLAELHFHNVTRSENCNSNTDAKSLAAVADEYRKISTVESDRAQADLTEKVNFGLARIHFCLAASRSDRTMTTAADYFQAVRTSYRESPSPKRRRIAAIAGESSGWLSVIALQRGDPESAANYAREAIQLAARDSRRQAIFFVRLGEARQAWGDLATARTCYLRAERAGAPPELTKDGLASTARIEPSTAGCK